MEDILSEASGDESTFSFQSVYFFNDMSETSSKEIPENFHMMKHTNRSANYRDFGSAGRDILIAKN